MIKSSKNKDKYISQVIKRLASKYKVTEKFVRLSIRGERTSERAIQISAEYKEIHSKINNIINI